MTTIIVTNRGKERARGTEGQREGRGGTHETAAGRLRQDIVYPSPRFLPPFSSLPPGGLEIDGWPGGLARGRGEARSSGGRAGGSLLSPASPTLPHSLPLAPPPFPPSAPPRGRSVRSVGRSGRVFCPSLLPPSFSLLGPLSLLLLLLPSSLLPVSQSVSQSVDRSLLLVPRGAWGARRPNEGRRAPQSVFLYHSPRRLKSHTPTTPPAGVRRVVGRLLGREPRHGAGCLRRGGAARTRPGFVPSAYPQTLDGASDL